MDFPLCSMDFPLILYGHSMDLLWFHFSHGSQRILAPSRTTGGWVYFSELTNRDFWVPGIFDPQPFGGGVSWDFHAVFHRFHGFLLFFINDVGSVFRCFWRICSGMVVCEFDF